MSYFEGGKERGSMQYQADFTYDMYSPSSAGGALETDIQDESSLISMEWIEEEDENGEEYVIKQGLYFIFSAMAVSLFY